MLGVEAGVKLGLPLCCGLLSPSLLGQHLKKQKLFVQCLNHLQSLAREGAILSSHLHQKQSNFHIKRGRRGRKLHESENKQWHLFVPKMTGPFQNGRNKVLFFHMKGWFGIFLLLQGVCFVKTCKKSSSIFQERWTWREGNLLLNVKMKTHLYFSFFFTEWRKRKLFACCFSMHPTTSTTRTCRGEEE